jgi:hypothetical protein
MEPVGIIVITATFVFVCLAVLSAVAGVILWSRERTRFLGPFVTFVPTLALLGASGGSWTLALLTARVAGSSPDAPWLAWLVGLGLGGVAGALLGWSLSKRKQGAVR